MSLKAGGVALNLTAASHVMLMDPWWNPAVEVGAPLFSGACQSLRRRLRHHHMPCLHLFIHAPQGALTGTLPLHERIAWACDASFHPTPAAS